MAPPFTLARTTVRHMFVVHLTITVMTIGPAFPRGAANAASLKDGGQYYLNKEYQKAFDEFETLAKEGIAQGQYMLALMYLNGSLGTRDPVAAANWFLKAAEQGHLRSQYFLATLYARGRGVPKDAAEAYFWASLSRFQLLGKQGVAAGKLAAAAGAQIGPVGRSEIQKRMDSWRPKRKQPKQQFGDPENLLGQGTGFFIAATGALLTNEHVISQCDRIIITHEGDSGRATVQDVDFIADLALLHADIRPAGVVRFLDGPRPPRGTAVTFFGYAPNESRSTTPLRSDGVIIAPEEYRGNPAWLTASTPTFSGESGSPLLDRSGRLVGVVRGTISNDSEIEKGRVQGAGSVAAGVDAVAAFLNRAHAPFTYAGPVAEPHSFPEKPPFMARIECWAY